MTWAINSANKYYNPSNLNCRGYSGKVAIAGILCYSSGSGRYKKEILGGFVRLIWLLLLACQLSWAEGEPPFVLRGEFTPGAMIIGQVKTPTADAQILIDGKKLDISPDGLFVFGLGRDALGQVSIGWVSKSSKATYHYKIAKRDYEIQKVVGVQEKHVNPPKDVMARIQAEGALVGAARQLNDARTDFAETFIWPLVGPITGVYGSQRFYNGEPKSPHYGLDIAAPSGTKVVAPAAGIVTLAEADLYFSGGTLILDHGHGVSSTFIHLSSVLVGVGQRISQGQIIAEVGATGRATGPHLDWRMNWFSERLDPALLMQNIPMKH